MSRIEDSVAKKIQERAELGKNKYGVTMERNDLTNVEWLKHAQEEAMDLAVYLEKLINENIYQIYYFKFYSKNFFNQLSVFFISFITKSI